MTSTIDDQQERHYIGNLLCEEDVFGHTNGRSIIETNVNGSVPAGNVLPSSGPIGPTPNRTFWPEPPPPYSPCTITPPHWAAVGHHHLHQDPGVMTPPSSAAATTPSPLSPSPSVSGPYGQLATAVAGTRADFYQSSLRGHEEWSNIPGITVEGYVHNGMSYSPHRAVSILKPLMTSGTTLDSMQQHHYQNMYCYHQQHPGSAAIHPQILRAPPPTPAYSELDKNGLLHIDPYLSQHISLKGTKKAAANLLQVEDVTPSVFSKEVVAVVSPPLGKSYRDVASRRERTTADSSLVSNTKTTSRNNASVSSAVSCVGSIDCTGQGGDVKCHRDKIMTKKVNDCGKKKAENEFKKITHKKNKGAKNSKSDVVITDVDGLTSIQAVDASSRFDILHSLGTQATNTVTRRITRRSLSSGIVHREIALSAGETNSKLGVEKIASENVAMGGETIAVDKIATDCNCNESKRTNISVQRSVQKKLVGPRRELGAHTIADSTKCGRKQRNSAKKRQSTLTDYTNFVVTLVISIVMRSLQWIMNLIIDISMQLWDITLFTISTSYMSVVFNCQRCWYSLLNSFRSYWGSMCTKRMWVRQKKPSEWGLNDNIQLPVTGEEAMERILKCFGRDAYVVLGLRANCTDDDIKRYYKRQAVLVHPDKNRLNGSEEAFKILSKAFDAIGTPDARNRYNIANLYKNPLHKEMEELWKKLREKMSEARNAMYCDCGGKHTRIPVESIRASEARYCKKCNLRHPAKHNDIWAESRYGGFVWVYYACLDGVIYDITQWAKCSSNHLKHIKANNHAVQYRLVTTTGPAMNKNSMTQNKTRHRQRSYDNFCCYNRGGQEDDGCSFSIPFGYNDMITKGSEQVSYRPPEKNLLNGDRPRRFGRRRKQR